jgi:phosphoribosylaminoimidazole carboxylase (NCAIR synthetase)
LTKTIAVLGGGQDSLGILRRIKEMGLRTIVFDGDKEAPARGYLADDFVGISCYDSWHICRYLALQTAHTFDGVLGGGTDTPDIIADMLHLRGMRGLTKRTAEISKNKWVQKYIFHKK